MKATIRPATLRDMTFLAGYMRKQDRREIGAVFGGNETEIGIALYTGSEGLCWTAWLDGQAVAAFGIAHSRGFDGLGSGWAYGTDRMRRAVPAITRFMLGTVRPALIAGGFRRVEVRTAIDHDLSHRWLRSLGFRRECVVRHYGSNGLHFIQYAATDK